MEALGVERISGRPIWLLDVAGCAWETPPVVEPFTLLVAGSTSPADEALLREFAAGAIASGCRYVCAWGEGCERLHDVFDEVSIATDRFVMSTWHSDEELHDALYFVLVTAIPEQVSKPAESAVILAVEDPWIAEVRRLVGDQEELSRLWVRDEE